VRLLCGESEDRLLRLGLTKVPTFGRLADRPQDWVQRALTRCVTAGWVDFAGDEHPVVRLSADGLAVMRGLAPARWLPPPAERPRATGAGRRRERAPAHDEQVLDAHEQALFDRLRELRLRLASAEQVPAYVVAHDRTLRELARLQPSSVAMLQLVPGLGPSKIERFGAAFLEVIAAA